MLASPKHVLKHQQVPVDAPHVVDGKLQQGCGERRLGGHCHHPGPSVEESGLCGLTEKRWHGACLGLRQKQHKCDRFFAPSPSHLKS